VLEQDRVAEHEIRRDEPGHLVAREVPRHDPEQRADRALGDDGVPALDLDRLVREQRRTVLGVVPEDIDDDADLAAALVDPLPHLQRHDPGQLVRPLLEQVRRPRHDRGPLPHGSTSPVHRPGHTELATR